MTKKQKRQQHLKGILKFSQTLSNLKNVAESEYVNKDIMELDSSVEEEDDR